MAHVIRVWGSIEYYNGDDSDGDLTTIYSDLYFGEAADDDVRTFLEKLDPDAEKGLIRTQLIEAGFPPEFWPVEDEEEEEEEEDASDWFLEEEEEWE